jgi:hypothetical protein
MPPEEKKRGAGRAKGAASTVSGPPAGGMNAFMAEIQAKQAAKNAAAAK